MIDVTIANKLTTDNLDISGLLSTLYLGQALTQTEMAALFSAIMAGELTEVQLAAALIALKVRGETSAEITGAALAMRRAAIPFRHQLSSVVDSCGTGGDGTHTINISTTAAIVAASLGVTVAKHGNRSVSSRSGSADLLEQLGFNLTLSPEQAAACLANTGFCFLFAPQYHQGVRHAMPVRNALKTRTLFNILGPLANPAAPTEQLLGVYCPSLLQPMAETLAKLGCKRAMVVYGAGMDEIALHGITEVCELKHGEISHYQLTAADFGLTAQPLSAIAGGSPEQNAQMTLAILQGTAPMAHQQAVAANVAALLYLTDRATSLADGSAQALGAMQSGIAFNLLQHAVAASHG